MQVPRPRGTRRLTQRRFAAFAAAFWGLLVGNTARHGTDHGEGVSDSHATPVPSRLPPPPRGRELHPLALPPEAPWAVARRLPALLPEPPLSS